MVCNVYHHSAAASRITMKREVAAQVQGVRVKTILSVGRIRNISVIDAEVSLSPPPVIRVHLALANVTSVVLSRRIVRMREVKVAVRPSVTTYTESLHVYLSMKILHAASWLEPIHCHVWHVNVLIHKHPLVNVWVLPVYAKTMMVSARRVAHEVTAADSMVVVYVESEATSVMSTVIKSVYSNVVAPKPPVVLRVIVAAVRSVSMDDVGR